MLKNQYFRSKMSQIKICWCKRFDKYHVCYHDDDSSTQIIDFPFRNAMSSPPPRDPGGPEAGPSKPRLEPGPSTVVQRLEHAGPSTPRLDQAGPSMTRVESGAGPSNTRPSSRPSIHPPSSSGRWEWALLASQGALKVGSSPSSQSTYSF